PLPRRERSEGGLATRPDVAAAHLLHRAGSVGRGPGKGLGRRMRQAHRRGDQRLPRTAGATGRGDVRFPLRRHAAGRAGTARRGPRRGGTRMNAAVEKRDLAAGSPARTPATPAAITLIEAITLALAYEMRNDPAVLVLGEDVGVNGGVFRATAGLQQQFGPERVLDTPLDETTTAGLPVRLAVQGMKPVAEAQFDGFVYPMVDH